LRATGLAVQVEGNHHHQDLPEQSSGFACSGQLYKSALVLYVSKSRADDYTHRIEESVRNQNLGWNGNAAGNCSFRDVDMLCRASAA
jgi:hypothetical protein